MQRILLLSDTHNHFDSSLSKYADSCDEIWHAGDIGDSTVSDALLQLKPLRAVYGNIDGQGIRKQFPAVLNFKCENVSILMTHIGGKPDSYSAATRELLLHYRPHVFICGHSHILLIKRSTQFGHLHLNPGAAGIHGFHHVKTMLRFVVDNERLRNMEVIELGPRASKRESTIG
jgi:hypothetical protein